jgi:hypothetical protein
LKKQDNKLKITSIKIKKVDNKFKKPHRKTLSLSIKIKKADENIKKQNINFKLSSNKIIK